MKLRGPATCPAQANSSWLLLLLSLAWAGLSAEAAVSHQAAGKLLAAVGAGEYSTSRDGRLHGIAYSPYDSSPGWCKPPEAVEADLLILKRVSQRIRLFSILPCPHLIAQILEFAGANNMTVLLGIWVGPDVCAAYDEINALPPLLASYAPAIEGVMVGNEAIYSRLASVPQLADYLAAVRNLIKPYNLSLGCVDIKNSWIRNDVKAQLIPLLDIVGINDHPYWDSLQVVCPPKQKCPDAFSSLKTDFSMVCKLLKPGQRCVLTETGWPTYGYTRGRAVPNPSNAAIYLSEVLAYVDSSPTELEYYWFEAFDSMWKATHLPCSSPNPQICATEHNWGLLTVAGEVKPPLNIFDVIAERSKAA